MVEERLGERGRAERDDARVDPPHGARGPDSLSSRTPTKALGGS